MILAELDLPIEFDAGDGIAVSISEGSTDKSWSMSVSRQIDPSDLTLVKDSGWTRKSEDGTEVPLPMVLVPRDGEIAVGLVVQQVVAALSFLLDGYVSFSASGVRSQRLVPETAQESALLETWGTDEVLIEWSVTTLGGSVTGRIGHDEVTAVLRQQAGLRLYENALRAADATVRFRELWKVFESAFGITDDALVDLLSAYAPVTDLGVDREELRALLILRGRASHAQSKAGLRELVEVERLCSDSVSRLKTLVERVLETKKSWGYPTPGVEELLREGRRVSLTERGLDEDGTLTLG